MGKFFLHAVACCCMASYASSAFAINISAYHDSIKNRKCDNCNIYHNAKDEMTDLDENEAKELAKTIGYTIISKPERKKDYYIMLGKKGGFYSELHVKEGRKIYVDRMVDKNDPQWGSNIQQ
ncbi:hypothetical protein [Methylobacterium tarhaniae]|uniref:hypothetical protein n=1 Tax=Methylobacterium tarhaniae TaxID=1187852 RepID=UPI000B17C65A|nr:hypothetical protein [Methylobacterium tarhaniae]